MKAETEMKVTIECVNDVEIVFEKVEKNKCIKILNWWLSGNINNCVSNEVFLNDITINRSLIKSIKFEYTDNII